MMRAVVSRSVAGAPLKAQHASSKKCGVGRGRRQFALCRFWWSSSNGTTGRWSGRDRRRGTRSALRGGTLFASEEEEEEEEDKKTDDDTDDDDTKTDFIRAAASLQFGSAAAAAASGKDDDVNDDEKSKQRRSKGGGVAPGLYVVSTPIGNLEDITIRGLKILTEASVLLCEDTRKTRHLLTLLGVQSRGKRFLAYHSHNFYEQREQLRDRILENKDEEVIALVSDAGAPGVSDPGQDLVDLVLEATSTSGGGGGGGDASVNNVVVPIPGASAVTTAVIGSGFKCDDGYKFCGFLPSKKNERIKKLESLTSERSLLVFFVSPHKLVKTLEDVAKVYSSPPRRVCVARELTKRHEEFFRGTCEECLDEFSKEGRARGEVTLLIESNAGASKNAKNTTVAEDVNALLLEKSLRHLLLERTENPLSVSEAARKVSQDLGVKRRVAYSMAQKIKDSHHHRSSASSDSN
jgi:16S rRNA (cytidine1402-2'-O)-methyltransferase